MKSLCSLTKLIPLSISLMASHYSIANSKDTEIASSEFSVNQTVNSFESLFGITPGKRRNHTKGFCFQANFVPVDSNIQAYTTSPLFRESSKVIGRLSHKGGNNTAPDNKPAEYGMGLSITATSGEIHRMAMNTLDFFPVATPQAFAELMQIKNRKSPAEVNAFKQKNKFFKQFKEHIANKKSQLTPYEGNTYNSINSFYLVNDNNEKTAVRWSFVPEKSHTIVTKPEKNFFFENMQKNLSTQGITWNMLVTFANPEDAIDNAAIPWTGKHKQLVAAKLKITSINSEQLGQCDIINFDPLVLSSGFEPSADPLLNARSKAYAISFSRRMSERKQQKNP